MGAWSLYFLAKLGLYWGQTIGLHWVENLAFAAVLAWPLKAAKARRWRHALAVPVAVALLYRDSFLPPIARVWSQMGTLATFTPDYLLELAERFVSWPVIAAVAVLAFAYAVLARRLRFATLVFLGLVAVPVLPAPGTWGRTDGPTPTLNTLAEPSAALAAAGQPLALGQLDAALQSFYATESAKTVALPAVGTPGFDLVFLSVCSLSWDDLDEVRMRDAPPMPRFDIVFRQFNSAASYSGPAVLRLLHASCGQTTQPALYESQPDACYLFRSLAQAGYKPALLMNHDGHFDKFADQLRDQGGLGQAPERDTGAPVAMHAFDGTPIQADFEVLSRWYQPRSADAAPFALLYNTVTMHDGNRVPGLASNRSRDTYKPRLEKLFADLERFIALVEASGRPTVLVLVPEHGGAVRGDAVQISGLREIPTPAITGVPAAVKLIGFKGLPAAARPISVERPSSYFALAALVAQLMQAGPGLAGRETLEATVRDLPGTDWVAENEGTVLLRRGPRSYLRTPQGEWSEFAAQR